MKRFCDYFSLALDNISAIGIWVFGIIVVISALKWGTIPVIAIYIACFYLTDKEKK